MLCGSYESKLAEEEWKQSNRWHWLNLGTEKGSDGSPGWHLQRKIASGRAFSLMNLLRGFCSETPRGVASGSTTWPRVGF